MIEQRRVPGRETIQRPAADIVRATISREIGEIGAGRVVRAKFTRKGHRTFVLSDEAKKAAAPSAYQALSQFSALELNTAAKEIRENITAELRTVRKEVGKDNVASDPRFLEAQAQRRMLASVVQRARIAEKGVDKRITAFGGTVKDVKVLRQQLLKEGIFVSKDYVQAVITKAEQERLQAQQEEAQRITLKNAQAMEAQRRQEELDAFRKEAANRRAVELQLAAGRREEIVHRNMLFRLQESIGWTGRQLVGQLQEMFATPRRAIATSLTALAIAGALSTTFLPRPERNALAPAALAPSHELVMPAPTPATPIRLAPSVPAPIEPIYIAPRVEERTVAQPPAAAEKTPDVPYKVVYKKRNLGTRSDIAEIGGVNLMKLIQEKTPFTGVRISIEEGGELSPQLQAAISEAKKQKLHMLLVFNPKQDIPIDELRQRVRILKDELQAYRNITIEYGNEVDHPKDSESGLDLGRGKYWKNADLQSYVKSYEKAKLVMQEEMPGIPLVASSLVNPVDHAWDLIQAFRKAGVDPKTLTFAIHVYTEEDVRTRIDALREAIGTKEVKFLISELGGDPSKIPSMLAEAEKEGSGATYVHEFPPVTPFGSTKMDGDKLTVTPVVGKINDFAKLHGGSPREI